MKSQSVTNMKEYEEQLSRAAAQLANRTALYGKSLLVTGATGLIGKFLIDLLMYLNEKEAAGIMVAAVGRDEVKARERLGEYWSRKEFSYIRHDVTMPFAEPVRADYIICGASNTHPLQYAHDPVGTVWTNIAGLKNTLELAVRQNKCRTVFLSSVEIYGECLTDQNSFREEDMGYIDCNTLRAGYPESKRAGEALCQAYIIARKADVVTARLCRTYGPTMQPEDSKAIAQFIKNAVAERDIVLKSAGNQCYSYAYVADCVTAVLTLLLCGRRGEAYNVASDSSDRTLRSIAERLAEFSGRKVIFEIPDEVEKSGYSKATRALVNTSRLKKLGWTSSYDMDKGLEATVRMLRENGV